MNIRTRIKWLDPVTQQTILSALSVILFTVALKTQDKRYVYVSMVLFVIAALYLLYTIKKGQGLILENRFGGPIKFKPEEGCNAEPLTTLPQKADGINTGIYPGKVYKLRSGTNVYIDEQGRVCCYSFISRWVNPGWISADAVHNDSCWLTLF